MKNTAKHWCQIQIWTALLGCLLLPTLSAAEVAVGELTLISSARVSRVAVDFTYKVNLNNTGGAVENVTATVSSTASATTIIEGSLSFPDIAAGGTVTSSDTFTLRQDRRFAFDSNALVFDIQYTPTGIADSTPPQISIVSPAAGTLVIESRPVIQVQASDDIELVPASLALTANGQPLTADCLFAGDTAQCNLTADLPEGAVILGATVDDSAGNTGTTQTDFVVDSVAIQIEITSPADGLIAAASDARVTGTVNAGVTAVDVNGITASLSGGAFSTTVPLREGRNMIVAVATRASGRTGTDSVDVTRDIVAPIVSIDSPSDGFVSVNDVIAVTGKVNDIVSGGTDARVFVNGLEATVAGGSYLVVDVPLVRGSNTITAVGTDSVGNEGSRSITVTFQPPVGARMTEGFGNGQAAQVNQSLAEPLVAIVQDDLGNPVAGRVVKFEVTRNSGNLKVGAGDAPQRIIQVPTDGSGKATVLFTLGDTAGEGNNRVKASAVGVAGEVEFCASGLGAAAQKILMVDGDNQRGVVGFPLANPLEALVVDKDGNPLNEVDVTFSIAKGTGNFDGQSSQVRTTGTDGIARAVLTLGLDPGINNNVVSATFPGLTGAAASFIASGLAPGNPADTKFSGVVLDNGHNPIPGAVVSILETAVSATTDEEGQFLLENVPVGHIELLIDPGNSPRPETFPPLNFETVTVAGQTNILGQPILLPAVQTESSKLVGGNQDVTLKMPGVEGLELTVFANSVTCIDGASECQVSISQVHLDKVPMPPPSGTLFMPPAWTIQPAGTRFDPPAKISIPNDGLLPGRVIDIFQFDHTLNEFINVGKGTVSDDGLVIISDPGFGVTRAGWGGCGQPQPPVTCASSCDDGNSCTSDSCVNGSCTYANISGSCEDDGNRCTEDTCANGSCQHTLVDDCSCDTDADCDDNNICTSETCENSVCVFAPANDGGSCGDGDQECSSEVCQGGECKNKPKDDGLACDDSDFCTGPPDVCKSGVCEGEPVKPEQVFSFQVGVDFAKVVGPINRFNERLGGPCKVALGFAVDVTRAKECCSEKEAIVDFLTGNGGGQAGVACNFPTPFSIPLGPVKVGIFIDAALTANATLSVKNDKCVDKLDWGGGGAVKLSTGITGRVKVGSAELLKISGVSGASCPLQVQNNQVVCRLSHNGLVVSVEVELLNGVVSVADNFVIFQPGGDLPVTFGLPQVN